MQKKGKKFDWNQKYEDSFKKWKTLLTSAPILRIADPNKDFIVCTNACNDGLGGVLTQEGYVIAYESRKLKIHEKNYATYDLELVAVIHALKMWHHHLIGRKFILMTNNKGLKYMLDQPTLNARWLAFLSEYDFEIQHIKGKENKVVDALSRNAKLNFIATINNYKTYLEEELEDGIGQDENYQKLQAKVRENLIESLSTRYNLNEKGLLLYKDRLYVPNVPKIKLLI